MTVNKSDRALLWLLSVPILGVATNLISDWLAVENNWAAFIPPFLLAVAMLVTAPAIEPENSGFLSRVRYGPTHLGKAVAGIFLLGYAGGTAYASQLESAIWLQALSAICLWGAATLLSWSVLQVNEDLGSSGVGVAILLGGVMLLTVGVEILRQGETLGGVAVMLMGVALLVGVVAELREEKTLHGIVALLLAVAFLLVAVAGLRQGQIPFGMASLLVALASLLFAMAELRPRATTVGVVGLLFAVASLMFAVAVLRQGVILVGTAALLFAVASLLFAVAVLRYGDTLPRVGVLLVAVSVFLFAGTALLVAVAALRYGNILGGLAIILMMVAFLLSGLRILLQGRRPNIGQHLRSFWLTRRD